MLGALAVAEPSSAASMLGDMMGKLSAAAPRLAAMRTPGKGEPPVSGNRGEIVVQMTSHPSLPVFCRSYGCSINRGACHRCLEPA